MSKLEGKVAIITGGAGGIGLGMATAFVKAGAKVAIVDVNADSGNRAVETLQTHQSDAMFIHADLMDRDNLPNIVETVVEKFGQLDILVNNAHATRLLPFEDVTQADLDLSFNTGFYPTFYLMQAALPHLKATQGHVINFASGAGINGDSTQAPYAAAKEAIRGISRVAANEWGPYGINVNVISPLADSEGVRQWRESEPEYYERVKNNIPLRRFGDVEKDIGSVAVFLASDDSDYITGQTFMVDGGSVKLV